MILRWKAYQGWNWCIDGPINMLEDKDGNGVILDNDMMDFYRANYNNTDFLDLFYKK